MAWVGVVGGNALASEPTDGPLGEESPGVNLTPDAEVVPTETGDDGGAIAPNHLTYSTHSTDALAVELAQVTNVSELDDVLTTDWAYIALTQLVEEYGCIEGYPDRSFRGSQAVSRYEFAAGLESCLATILLLTDSLDDTELETVQRLQEEFATELASIRGRVDTLEADVAELEANQFSTTTKLQGRVFSHLTGVTASGDIQAEGINVFAAGRDANG
ncbi:MAG: iron uptake porin, partial [Cyanobacteria bacterium P01_D01_bin.2]